MPEPVLVAEDVAVTYGRGASAVAAVRGLDFSGCAGETLLLMGPSGSGKTSLLLMLGALLSPTRGRVLLEGADLYGMDGYARARVRLRCVGFIFQSFNLFSALTALDNVAIPMRLAGSRAAPARARASKLLADVGLESRARHRPSELSGGEQQRVAFARCLANDPAIILADEPTANLDSVTGAHVAEMLTELAHDRRKLVVIVSHDARLAAIADRVLRVEDGRFADGT